jgi:hypothetical protein
MNDEHGVQGPSPALELEAALIPLRANLVSYIAALESDEPRDGPPMGAEDERPSTLALLGERFGLTPFECDVLLLCAAVEVDGQFATLCARANGDESAITPTFGLALAVFADPDWRALLPSSPLRYWHLLEVPKNQILINAPLRIDETILHFLLGVRQLDERLLSATRPIVPGRITASQRRAADEIAAALQTNASRKPIVQICGSDELAKRTIAIESARSLGLSVILLSAVALATDENPRLAELLWQRESILGLGALVIECDQLESDAASWTSLTRLLEAVDVPIMLSVARLHPLTGLSTVAFDVARPSRAEQQEEWRRLVGSGAELGRLPEELAYQFDFTLEKIGLVWESAVTRVAETEDAIAPRTIVETVWTSARAFARSNLDELATRVETRATWDDLVLPAQTMDTLHTIVAQVRHRNTVYETWKFGSRTSRGLGVSVLFSGSSGTGKTLASEVIARALHVDLYRIDLSTVVSKYIGETEKNLRKIFDEAESAGVVLLFDEADALFGKRGEVKDSHDRYANVEVSYLLQRMEEYTGLAILTTNLKTNIDLAFLRRLRFVVDFPFPDAPQREQIWRHMFGRGVPVEDLDYAQLSSLSVAGGDIYNIALNAAFLAAAEERGVAMRDIFVATRMEFGKQERVLTAAETRGWN